MAITIALAGNPNSGKTTLFNELTGSHQYVGNWPGVTVEHKTGEYTKDRDIKITDLPGIYSLSPYTLEEVVTRDYLLSGEPDVIVDVIDASNLERNLYLATQLAELGLPVVLALNMIDIVEKNNDKIDIGLLEKELKCRVIEVSALKNKNIDKLIELAIQAADDGKQEVMKFSNDLEDSISKIEGFSSVKKQAGKRFIGVKLFEKDSKILSNVDLTEEERKQLDDLIIDAEEKYDDDTEGIIINDRYDYISSITDKAVVKGRIGPSFTEKLDRFVTSRIFSIPIFALVMTSVYWLSITVAGGFLTDVLDNYILDPFTELMEFTLKTLDVSPSVESLVLDGIIGGVGGVLEFLPIIASLFFLIAILEDVGYMSRIAFILDKVFRKFGLSGKSFIPILIGTGCSVPGIIGTRTIENDSDRRLTITVASMMPCGAKTDIIAMFAAVLGDNFWFGPIWYFGGIIAVIISGLILKKTRRFRSNPTPFVMELPDYHMPSMKNVFKATWFRVKSFIIKAGTVILLSSVLVWALQNISVTGEFIEWSESGKDSILSFLGHKIAWIFTPLGFGDWMAAVATFLGLIAKEMVVSTFGVLASLGEVEGGSGELSYFISKYFTKASMLSFMFYNQFTIPCFAAVGAIRQEMADRKWFTFAMTYILVFSYSVVFMIYQFARIFVDKEPADIWTWLAVGVLAIFLYLMFRPYKEDSLEKGEKLWEI